MYKDDFIIQLVNYYKKSIELLGEVKLTQNVEGITHQVIIPKATYSPWLDHTEFLGVYEIAKPYTLVDIFRCWELYSFISRNKHLKGDVLEVGVWKGGTGSILGKSLKTVDKQARIFLADTFKGVVKAGENDTFYKGGEHSDTSVKILLELLEKQGLDNYIILEGVFPDEIKLPEDCDMLRLCHIDVDTYESANHIIKAVWPLIVPGGAVFFDDFGFWGCEGITRLCNELKIDNSIFIHNLNGHGVFVKVK